MDAFVAVYSDAMADLITGVINSFEADGVRIVRFPAGDPAAIERVAHVLNEYPNLVALSCHEDELPNGTVWCKRVICAATEGGTK